MSAAFDLSAIQKGAPPRAPLVVIHGQPGEGKTTFAVGAPNPVFVQTEDGLGIHQPDAFPVATEWSQVISAIASLYESDHKTVVIDSLSALEPLIWKQVSTDNNVSSIEQIGYGKGYIFAMEYWQELIKACQGLTRQGKTVILIAHTDVVKFDPPDGEAYDRYQVKLHKRAVAHLVEQADVIGFAHMPVYVKKDDSQGSGKAKSKGDQRLLRVAPDPAVIAKNRYQMPEIIRLEWADFAANIPFFNA